MKDMGENGFQINGQSVWGQTMNYRYGYLTGLLIQRTSPNEKWQFDIGLGNNSFIGESLFESPLKWQLSGRIGLQANWATHIGISLRHAKFKELENVNSPIVDHLGFAQSQIGLDYKFGFSFFEITGEIVQSFFNVPEYSRNTGFGQNSASVEASTFRMLSFYNDIRFEPGVLPGSYIALRLETMQFNKGWDNNVWRYSLVTGYKINRFVLIRAQYSIQDVLTKSWNQNIFKLMLTLHI
jgi:hypothetical protein